MKSWSHNRWGVLLSVLVAALGAAALAQTTGYQYDRSGNLRQTTVSCNPGFVLCGENCVPSVLNCGACGTSCSTNNVTPACSAGSCNAGVCAHGWDDCNGNKQSDGCETDLTSSIVNCNACGNACSTNHVDTGLRWRFVQRRRVRCRMGRLQREQGNGRMRDRPEHDG